MSLALSPPLKEFRPLSFAVPPVMRVEGQRPAPRAEKRKALNGRGRSRRGGDATLMWSWVRGALAIFLHRFAFSPLQRSLSLLPISYFLLNSKTLEKKPPYKNLGKKCKSLKKPPMGNGSSTS